MAARSPAVGVFVPLELSIASRNTSRTAAGPCAAGPGSSALATPATPDRQTEKAVAIAPERRHRVALRVIVRLSANPSYTAPVTHPTDTTHFTTQPGQTP